MNYQYYKPINPNSWLVYRVCGNTMEYYNNRGLQRWNISSRATMKKSERLLDLFPITYEELVLEML